MLPQTFPMSGKKEKLKKKKSHTFIDIQKKNDNFFSRYSYVYFDNITIDYILMINQLDFSV